MSDHRPLVSVIVPTRNSAATLAACLDSVRRQSYGNVELIVVDNHSGDATAAIAREHGARFFSRGPERSAQRNFGAAQAAGEFVVFIDSDMELGPGVIEAAVREMAAGPRWSGLVIPEESFGEGFWAECKRLERSFYVGVPWMEAARFFPRQLFIDAGGYDEGLVSGEDWDLSRRLERSGPAGRISEYIRHNEGRPTLGRIVRKKLYYAGKISGYSDKRPGDERSRKQLSPASRYALFLSHPGRLFRRPLLGLGVLFMKTCEFGFGGLGYLWARRGRRAASAAGRRPVSVMYVTHHLIRNSGNISGYLRETSDRCCVFAISPTFMAEPCRFEAYEGGTKVGERSYRWYKGRNLMLQYLFFYLYFCHARLLLAGRGTDVLTFHPLFCIGHRLFRLFRGGRTVFWVFDYFPERRGLYMHYNRLADFYVARLPRVLFLSESMRAIYDQRLRRRPDAVWDVAGLGIKLAAVDRRPMAGLLGFVGNLKFGQGLEAAIEALTLDRELSLEIVGEGVTRGSLEKLAADQGVADRVRFFGAVIDDGRLAEIAARWELGLAVYRPVGPLAYADPGKLKLYWQLGLPVLTSRGNPAAEAAARSGAAVLVEADKDGILRGVRQVRAHYQECVEGVMRFRRQFEYRGLYDAKLGFLRLDGATAPI